MTSGVVAANAVLLLPLPLPLPPPRLVITSCIISKRRRTRTRTMTKKKKSRNQTLPAVKLKAPTLPYTTSPKAPKGFAEIVRNDKEFIHGKMRLLKHEGLSEFVSTMEDVFYMRGWESESYIHTQHTWPRAHYPELSGKELATADLELLREYINYMKDFFRIWNSPLPESYAPDKVADYFNRRPHVLLVRILEVFGAFLYVILNSKLKQGFKGKPDIMDETKLEKESKSEIGETLKETMLRLGPTFIKAGQTISTRPDIVGEEIAKALTDLQDQLPPFPTQKALEIIEDDLGHPVDASFSFLSEKPIAAASFGQVYKGCTMKGEPVAVKVQRPHALYNVARDIYMLRIFSGALGRLLRRKHDLRLYVDEIGRGFWGELDYSLEAGRASEFQKAHSNLPFIVVPKPFMELTGKRVLTMEWISGDKPKDLLLMSKKSSCVVRAVSEKDRFEARTRLLSLVNNGVEACLVQLLETGLLHADPHPGNLICTPSGQLGFLDFGLLCRMEKKHQLGMLASIVHITNADWSSFVYDLAAMDILRPETDIKQVQMELHIALGEVNTDGGIPDVNFSKVLGKILSIALKYHLKMPAYYTLVLRSIASLEGLALAVDPNFKTFQAAYPYVVHKLLHDNSKQMRNILHSVVFNDKKELEWSKVLVYAKMLEQFLRTRDARLGYNQFYTVGKSEDTDPALLAFSMAKFLSSKDGAVIRRLLFTADTSSLAHAFVSGSSGPFCRNLVIMLTNILYDWMSRNLIKYLGTSEMERESTGMKSMQLLIAARECWKDIRMRVVLKAAIGKLRKKPLLMACTFCKMALLVFWSAALSSHRLLVLLSQKYLTSSISIHKSSKATSYILA